MSHTPGPWTLRWDDDRLEVSAGVMWRHSFHSSLESDAHLIAAAPDLLAALESLVAEEPEEWDDPVEILLEARHLSAIRAAVAKAKQGDSG